MKRDIAEAEGVDEYLLRSGYYATKQLYCSDPIIAWSHRRRYLAALRIARQYSGRKLLDYGCGDGTFLALAHAQFPGAVGAEMDRDQTRYCKERFAGSDDLSFVTIEDLKEARHIGAYGLIFCMEVLEHCTETDAGAVCSQLRRLAGADGIVVVSVPVEIGPSLIVKQILRALAAWRRLSDYRYREKYTLQELIRMLFATSRTAIVRPVERSESGQGEVRLSHGHKGFNWRALRVTLNREFHVRRTTFSPIDHFDGLFASQAWFICSCESGTAKRVIPGCP